MMERMHRSMQKQRDLWDIQLRLFRMHRKDSTIPLLDGTKIRQQPQPLMCKTIRLPVIQPFMRAGRQPLMRLPTILQVGQKRWKIRQAIPQKIRSH